MSLGEFVWLLELPGPLYMTTAVSGTSVGFSPSAFDAWRFPTRETAELVRNLLNGALGARAVEHGFITESKDGK